MRGLLSTVVLALFLSACAPVVHVVAVIPDSDYMLKYGEFQGWWEGCVASNQRPGFPGAEVVVCCRMAGARLPQYPACGGGPGPSPNPRPIYVPVQPPYRSPRVPPDPRYMY